MACRGNRRSNVYCLRSIYYRRPDDELPNGDSIAGGRRTSSTLTCIFLFLSCRRTVRGLMPVFALARLEARLKEGRGLRKRKADCFPRIIPGGTKAVLPSADLRRLFRALCLHGHTDSICCCWCCCIPRYSHVPFPCATSRVSLPLPIAIYSPPQA